MSGCNDCNGLPQKGCADGIGISTTIDNHDGTFTLYYTDGSTFTTSNFTGPEGPPGPSGVNSWLLEGNAGTNPATNFLGTTNNQPLILRTNNIISGVISPINGNTSIGNSSLLLNSGSYNTSLGYNNLFSLTTGQFNIALGTNSLRVNSAGSDNIAIGTYTLATNRGKSNSIAIGTNAMQNADNSSSTGDTFNIAIGYKALFGSNSAAFNTGINNIAIGAESMENNTSGTYNVAIGTDSLKLNTSANGNTAIGYGTVSNNYSACIMLGATAAANGNNEICIGSNTYYVGTTGSATGFATSANTFTGGGSLPALAKFWTVRINGTSYKIPVYNV